MSGVLHRQGGVMAQDADHSLIPIRLPEVAQVACGSIDAEDSAWTAVRAGCERDE